MSINILMEQNFMALRRTSSFSINYLLMRSNIFLKGMQIMVNVTGHHGCPFEA